MFFGKTILERKNSEFYILKSELSFEGTEYVITVSDGLLTNGATIGRLLWTVIGSPFTGRYVGSAIIHDGLYASHILSRKESDKFLEEMLIDNGFNKILCRIVYYLVRIFGHHAYYAKSDDYISEMSKYVKIKKK